MHQIRSTLAKAVVRAGIVLLAALTLGASPALAATPDGGAGGPEEPIVAPAGFSHAYYHEFKLAVKVCKAENRHKGLATKQWKAFEEDREELQAALEAAGLEDRAPFVDWITIRREKLKNGAIVSDGCTGVG